MLPRAVNGWRRSYAVLGALAAALGMVACGGGSSQFVGEPSGNFPVTVATVSFPPTQRLTEHTHLVITVRNAGTKDIPDLAVTICNRTCSYPAPPGQGTSVAPFAVLNRTPYVASHSKQVWVIDQPPGPCHFGCNHGPEGGGGQGGYVTNVPNTWAVGHPLKPGTSATFDWAVTAVGTGHFVVAWRVAAGLAGRAKAVLQGGGVPEGALPVTITGVPAQAYVDNSGAIVQGSGQ